VFVKVGSNNKLILKSLALQERLDFIRRAECPQRVRLRSILYHAEIGSSGWTADTPVRCEKRILDRRNRPQNRASSRILTGVGPVTVRQPRVRDRASGDGERIRYSPAILPRYARRSKSLEVLIPILYLKGISTGDSRKCWRPSSATRQVCRHRPSSA